jgi:hypothetical protein
MEIISETKDDRTQTHINNVSYIPVSATLFPADGVAV